MSGLTQLIVGIIIMIIALVVSTFNVGGIIFYGAAIFGFIVFIKGIINMIRGR